MNFSNTKDNKDDNIHRFLKLAKLKYDNPNNGENANQISKQAENEKNE